MDLSLISRYRQELMGFAIIGVLIAHTITLGHFENTIFIKTLNFLAITVFTRGFLFLSGLGQYFSLRNGCNVSVYYKKRYLRLLVPYILIGFPYFVFTDIISDNRIFAFLGHLSTFSFWYEGNYSGMWYISVTVLLYFLYPFYHEWVYSDNNKVIYKSGIVLLFLTLVNILLYFFSHSYYEKISIGESVLSMFFMGSLCMYLIERGFKFKINYLVWVILIGLATKILSSYSLLFDPYFKMLLCFICMIIYTKLFETLTSIFPRLMSWILTALKTFGKYTLELYISHMLFYYLLSERLFVSVDSRIIIIVSIALSLIVAYPLNSLSNRIICYFNRI